MELSVNDLLIAIAVKQLTLEAKDREIAQLRAALEALNAKDAKAEESEPQAGNG